MIQVLCDTVAGFSGPVRSADQISMLVLHSHVNISDYVSEHPGLLAGVQGWTKAGLCHTRGPEQTLRMKSRPSNGSAGTASPYRTRLAVRATFSPCRALTGAPMSGSTI